MSRILCSILISLAALTVEAQDRFLLGTGITYCSYLGTPGINLNVTYRVGSNFFFGPDFSAILNREKEENGVSIIKKETEFNFNAHYLFSVQEKFSVYPLTGINFSRVIVHPYGEEPEKSWITALNFGGGIEYELKTVRLFFESKYVTKLDKYDLTAGALFGIHFKK